MQNIISAQIRKVLFGAILGIVFLAIGANGNSSAHASKSTSDITGRKSVDFKLSPAIDAIVSSIFNPYRSIIQLKAAGVVVSGKVYYSITPVPNVTVNLIDANVIPHITVYTTTTNMNGEYVFSPVAAGYYWLEVLGPTSEYFPSMSFDLYVQDSNISANLPLEKIITQISPPNGSLIPTNSPTFCWQAPPEAVKYYNVIVEMSTPQYTYYDDRNITTTCYTTSFVLEGGMQYWWDVQAYDSFGNGVGSVVSNFHFFVGYYISGHVVDSCNKPISGVTLSDGSGHTATTDNNGNYMLSEPVAGTYTIAPSKSGYTFSPASWVVTMPPNAIEQNFTGSIQTELSVSHIEITQNIQDESNNVPLIAGRPTFVRVYVDCGEGCASTCNITGKLRGYGSLGELTGSPLSPSGFQQDIIAYHESWLLQRSDLTKTLNFTLPPEWPTGTVTLTAEIGEATRSETATFQSALPLNVVYVPIQYKGQSPDPERILTGFSWAARIYPTGEINYVSGTTFKWDQCLEDNGYCSYGEHMHNLLNQLTTMYRLLNAYVFGWLPEGTYGGGLQGLSDPTWLGGTGKAAFGFDLQAEGRRIFAHEIAHLMGRQHTNSSTCRPDQIDPSTDWPWVSSDSLIHEYGIDGYGFGWLIPSSSALKNPTDTYDYMSYCGSLAEDNVWTSPWTYEHIFSQTLKVPTTLLAQPLATPQPYFIASGLIYTDDTVNLDPIWVTTSTIAPENPPAGTQYCLEAQNASGTALASRCFDLTFVNYETGEPTNVDGFNLMLPYPGGVARIVLKKGTRELAGKLVSASAPVVTVLSPNGGETWSGTGTFTVSWTASDADGDPLTYSVLYSPNGTDWLPVGGSTTQTQITVNAAELAGSDNARIRVLASDGVNTSSDESDAIFTLGRKAPQAFILSPERDVTIPVGTPLWLRGYVYDLEDGSLGDASLRWSSSKDGDLGMGAEVLANLSSGQHVVTLTAKDSDNKLTTTTVNIFVGSRLYLTLVKR